MSSKLTVIFLIVLCLEAGIVLTLLPWLQPFGLGDWGDNYFLVYAVHLLGFDGLQQAVASGWVRGAVTGLGVVNLLMAAWEIANFRRTVRSLNHEAATYNSTYNATDSTAISDNKSSDNKIASRDSSAIDEV